MFNLYEWGYVSCCAGEWDFLKGMPVALYVRNQLLKALVRSLRSC